MPDTINAIIMTNDVYTILPILSDEKLVPSKPLMNSGVNSLDTVTLLIGLEDKYNIKLNVQNLKTDDITIVKLVEVVNQATIKSTSEYHDIEKIVLKLLRSQDGIEASRTIDQHLALKEYGMDFMDVIGLANQIENKLKLPLQSITDCIDQKHKMTNKPAVKNTFHDRYADISLAELIRITYDLNERKKAAAGYAKMRKIQTSAQKDAIVNEK